MLYLWIHVAGMAFVPLFLQVVWLALAVSQPLPFFWIELFLLVGLGFLPILWMQWSRPFSPFNILLLTVNPSSLSEDNRRILTALKSPRQRWLTAIASIVSLITLWLLYQYAPLAREAASFLPQFRVFGLLIAIVAYFLANLFLQVSFSVLPLIFLQPKTYNSLEPYPVEQIKQDFLVFGFPLAKALF
jgi:hypothetical protein